MLKTPLHQFHLDHGAQMGEFAGWEMPLVYGSGGGAIAEHEQTRARGGLFDVSHMGRVKISGRHARRLLEMLCTRKITSMQEGQCRYTLICNEQGGIKDDVIVMRMDDDVFLVVVNASNREKLLAHFEAVRAKNELKAKIEDQTLDTAMVAIQGPRVMDLISKISSEVPTLKRFRFTTKNLVIMKLHVARTGYTGEDGVEVILPARGVGMAMKLLFDQIDMKAEDAIIRPAGLVARDTLRLEACMPLYGHELGEEINALATGLDFAIAIDKDEDERGEPYVGMEALKKTRDEGGPRRILVGMKLDGKRVARQGQTIKAGDADVGIVTSGCPSPTVGCPIAMGYVDREHAEEGTTLQVDTGRASLDAVVTPMPFYKRG